LSNLDHYSIPQSLSTKSGEMHGIRVFRTPTERIIRLMNVHMFSDDPPDIYRLTIPYLFILVRDSMNKNPHDVGPDKCKRCGLVAHARTNMTTHGVHVRCVVQRSQSGGHVLIVATHCT
jgi:hypothetical protein